MSETGDKLALIWLFIIAATPFLVYSILSSIFEHSTILCFLSLPSGIIILYLWIKLGDRVVGPTEKWGWSESETSDTAEKKVSAEKYTVDERTSKKSGLFSRLLGGEKKCDKCGSELVYKEGAGSYYCPECQEYKWR